MANTSLTMQTHRRPPDGLALTWDAVAGASRYGFVLGVAGIPVPPLDQIMRGAAPGFALMGIPARFSGAIDMGAPAGDELQYGLVVYRGDGTLVPVPEVRYVPASKKPGDRDYYQLHPPPLQRPPAAEPPPPPPPPPPDPAPPQRADAPGPAMPAPDVGPPPAPRTRDPLPQPSPPRDSVPPPVRAAPPRPDPVAPAAGPPRQAAVAAPPPPAIPTPRPVPDPAAPARAATGAGGRPTPAIAVKVAGGPLPPSPLASLGLSVRTLLDAAELSLRPGWADPAEAERLLDEVAALAPRDPRLKDLRSRVDEARAQRGAKAAVLQARQYLENGDYWSAVTLYEQALARNSHDDDARQGLARGRALGRWSAQMAGAGADPRRLAEIGDEFATEAPDLAARAYEAAFRYRPDAAALQGWLLGLARGGQQDALVATARAGIAALPQGDAGTASAREEALARLERDAGTAGAEEAIARLVALVAAPPDAQGRRP